MAATAGGNPPPPPSDGVLSPLPLKLPNDRERAEICGSLDRQISAKCSSRVSHVSSRGRTCLAGFRGAVVRGAIPLPADSVRPFRQRGNGSLLSAESVIRDPLNMAAIQPRRLSESQC